VFTIRSIVISKTVTASVIGECIQVTTIFGQVMSRGISFLTVKSVLDFLLNEAVAAAYPRGGKWAIAHCNFY